MKKAKKILAGLLLLQMVFIGLAYTNWSDGPAEMGQPLLALQNAAEVDAIVISADDGRVSLTSRNGVWSVKEANDLPASESKVNGVLNSVLGLTKTWPVAKTGAAAERFEVDDEKFSKRLELKQGDSTLETLYLGTSPGYKKVHLRREQDQAIYAAAINSFDIPSTAMDWVDKSLLSIKEADIKQLSFNDHVLMRENDQWRLAGLAGAEEVNNDGVKKLVDFLSNLFVSSLVEGDELKQFKLLKPVVSLKVNDGTRDITYKMFAYENEAVVKSSLRDEWFKIAKFTVDGIKDLTRDDLVKAKAVENTAESVITVPGKDS